jgi:FkbM family methyltransferase
MISNKELIKKFNFNPKAVCYIGANEGQEIPDILKYFPNSSIYCFEPQKIPFKLLEKKFGKKSNIFLYNFALGSENKNLTIYTNNNNNNMSSSILEPKEHLNYHQHVTFEGTEEITVKKFSDLNINNIDYLNIDVQGYELEVLKGFDNLDKINYIKTEVNRKELYKDCALVKDLDKYLKKSNFLRVKTVWWGRTVPWGDAFYVKHNQLSQFEILFFNLRNKIQSIKGYFWFLSLLIKFRIIK